MISLSGICSRGTFKSSSGFLLLLAILMLSSCGKESELCPCGIENCQELGELNSGWEYILDSYDIRSACFNPLNDNELVYSAIDFTIGEAGIYVYNLETEESVRIYTGPFIFKVRWGVNDWILFNTDGGYVHRIRSNGDDLTLVSPQSGLFAPDWSYQGDTIRARVEPDSYTLLMDINGEFIDSISDHYSGTSSAWNHAYYGAATSLGNLVLKDLSNDSIIPLYSIEEDFRAYSGCTTEITDYAGTTWVGDDIYYTHSLGIFKSDINGSPSEKIKETCNSLRYSHPSVNESGTKLLFVKRIEQVVDGGNAKVARKFLVTMNLDGTEETVLSIP